MKVLTMLAVAVTCCFAGAPVAEAMCGCMVPIRPKRPKDRQLVAKKILNEASKVALVRDRDRTIMTMSNDVLTDYDEFGLIVPVPTVIKKRDVRVVEAAVFAALEQATNPRIVEKWDPDPCPSVDDMAVASAEQAPAAPSLRRSSKGRSARDFGVKVEAHYSVGEYDFAVLSAKKGAGGGLMTWLNKFHYAVPESAVPVLNSYIKQDMKFFVAKVNFRKVKDRGQRTFLRPIQVRYETPKFMLPVRLGTINADGPQELVAYMLSARARVEATNYRTVKMPTGQDAPLYVKDQFEKTYKAIFDLETKKNEMRVVFTEYVQRGGLSPVTHEKLGLGWDERRGQNFSHFTTTRLHFRYDSTAFPEDLTLQETADIAPFMVTYNVHHTARNTQCPAGEKYLTTLPHRRANEAKALASLTGWPHAEIREKVGLPPGPLPRKKPKPPWWRVW